MNLVARLLSAATVLLAAFAWADEPVGSPQDFAALSIESAGAEDLDLTTGITTLPQGGVIRYAKERVALSGSFIRYKEGDFIDVQGATVTAEFGTLSAPELRFEVARQTLAAKGGVEVTADGLELRADMVTLDLEADIAVLAGHVLSADPSLSAARALVDLVGRAGILVGAYTFEEGPFVLKGDAGELLALRWHDADGVSAETKVPVALRERFAALLE